MRIALTGGTGFIGRRFAHAARARGWRLRQLSRRGADAFNAGDRVEPFDLDREVSPEALAGCDALVHLAAYIPPDHADPAAAAACWRANAHGTLLLAGAAAAAAVPHVLIAGSANAYAATAARPDETAAMFPQSRGYYLGSKILQEIYAGEVCRRHGVLLAVARLGSVYGPGQAGGAIPAMLAAVRRGGPVRLAGGGGFGADFIHVDDAAAALVRLVETRAEGPFNTASGVRSTIAQVADALIRLAGRPIAIATEPGDPDPGFPPLDIARLAALGHRPRSLAEGLAEMWAAGG